MCKHLEDPEYVNMPETLQPFKYLLNTVALEGTIRIFCLERLLTLHSSKPPSVIYYTAKSIPCNEKDCTEQNFSFHFFCYRTCSKPQIKVFNVYYNTCGTVLLHRVMNTTYSILQIPSQITNTQSDCKVRLQQH